MAEICGGWVGRGGGTEGKGGGRKVRSRRSQKPQNGVQTLPQTCQALSVPLPFSPPFPLHAPIASDLYQEGCHIGIGITALN